MSSSQLTPPPFLLSDPASNHQCPLLPSSNIDYDYGGGGLFRLLHTDNYRSQIWPILSDSLALGDVRLLLLLASLCFILLIVSLHLIQYCLFGGSSSTSNEQQRSRRPRKLIFLLRSKLRELDRNNGNVDLLAPPSLLPGDSLITPSSNLSDPTTVSTNGGDDAPVGDSVPRSPSHSSSTSSGIGSPSSFLDDSPSSVSRTTTEVMPVIVPPPEEFCDETAVLSPLVNSNGDVENSRKLIRSRQPARYRCYSLLISLLFSSALLANLILLPYSIGEASFLIGQLTALPDHTDLLIESSLELANQSIDAAVNVTLDLIEQQSPNAPENKLVVVIDQLQYYIAQSIVYFVNQTTNNASTEKQLDLLPSSRRAIDQLHPIVIQLLASFKLVVGRLQRLDQVAAQLTSSWIRHTLDYRYQYQHQLILLSSTTSGRRSIRQLSTIPGDNSDNELSDVGLVGFFLCKSLNSSSSDRRQLGKFTSCEQVNRLIDQLERHATEFASKSPITSRSLADLLKYTLIPKGLHVDQEMHLLLPAINDPARKGFALLIDKNLTPMLESVKASLTNQTKSVVRALVRPKLTVSLTYITLGIVIFFILLILLNASIYLLLVHLFRITQPYHGQRLLIALPCCQRASSCLTLNFKQEPDNTSRCQRLRLLFAKIDYFLLIAFFSTILIASFCLVFLSLSVQRQGCVHLFQGQQQDEADCLLTRYIDRKIDQWRRDKLPPIDRLNLARPHSILATLDSTYQSGDPSLLNQLGLARPANLSALLNSDWLDSTLKRYWSENVDQKLANIDMNAKIKQLELLNSISRTHPVSVMRKSYDDLEVGPIDDYLDNPGPNHFHSLVEALKQMADEDAETDRQVLLDLIDRMIALSNIHNLYANQYLVAERAITVIEANKRIIDPMMPLIDVGSQAFASLQRTSNEQLQGLVSQLPTSLWPKLLSVLDTDLLPFVYNLTSRLVPFPSLRRIYHQAVEPLCQLPSNSPLLLASNQSTTLITPSLRRFGLTLFGLAFSTLTAAITFYHGLILFQ